MIADLLDMGYINSLPQPLWANLGGGDDWWWPVIDIEVQTGLLRLDICGMTQTNHIGDVMKFRDDCGNKHATDDFYTDSERAK